ncbi:MAG: YlbF family regulator [Clostridia bacterium]|nr:YlbF family regulator [Clostridia bacterium]
MEKIIEKAKELGALLEQSEIVKNQRAAKQAFDTDDELQQLIGDFNVAKLALMNESNKDKPDAEKTEKLRTQTTQSYEKVMAHPVMMQLNDAEIALEGLLNQVNGILQQSITGEEPGGCTHNCATCSGCH